MMLKKIVSDIRFYFLIICLIPFVLTGLMLKEHYDSKIIEVIEQLEESEEISEVSEMVLRTQRLSLYGTEKEEYSYSEFKNGSISGSLFFDYYFDDGSKKSEQINLKDIYEHKMPGVGSKRIRKSFIKGKYKIKSSEIVEKDSNEKLSIGDYADKDFEYLYEWSDLTPNLNPINAKAYSSRLISNGKVTIRSEIPYEVQIKP